MNPRHLKLFVLLLPLFIARSLLPIGFMVSFDAGIPQLVFCPSQVTLPTPTSGDAHALQLAQGHEHHHQHHEGADETSSSVEQNHQSCPFASAAAAPLVSAIAFTASPTVSEAIAAPSESAVLPFPSRAHPIRGPPLLS